jgi:hypothetical protein
LTREKRGQWSGAPSSNCLSEQGFLRPGGRSRPVVLHYIVTHKGGCGLGSFRTWHLSSESSIWTSICSDLWLEVGHELEPDLLLVRRVAERMARPLLPSYPTDHLKVWILAVAFKRRPVAISSLLFLNISPPTIAIYASWRIKAAASCAHNLASRAAPPSPG